MHMYLSNINVSIQLNRFIFWYITPCGALKVNRRIRGSCRFHLQGQRIRQARNQRESGSKQNPFTKIHEFLFHYESPQRQKIKSLQVSGLYSVEL
jgi:hypothetical protein